MNVSWVDPNQNPHNQKSNLGWACSGTGRAWAWKLKLGTWVGFGLGFGMYQIQPVYLTYIQGCIYFVYT